MTRTTLKTTFQAGALLIAGSLALSACAKKAPAELPPPPAPTTTSEGPAPMQGAVPGSQADFAAQMMGRDTVYFDTDKYNIDAEDQAALAQQAQWLTRYPAK